MLLRRITEIYTVICSDVKTLCVCARTLYVYSKHGRLVKVVADGVFNRATDSSQAH